MPKSSSSPPEKSVRASASRSRQGSEVLIWSLGLGEDNPVQLILIGLARPELVGRLDQATTLFPSGPLHDGTAAQIKFYTAEGEKAKVVLPTTAKPAEKYRAAKGTARRDLKQQLAELEKQKSQCSLDQRERTAYLCRAHGRPLGNGTVFGAGPDHDAAIAALQRKINAITAALAAKAARPRLAEQMPRKLISAENKPVGFPPEDPQTESRKWRAAALEIQSQECDPKRYFVPYRKAAKKHKLAWSQEFCMVDFRPLQMEGASDLVHACYLGIELAKAIQAGEEATFCKELIRECTDLKMRHDFAQDTQRVIEIIEEIAPGIFSTRKEAPTKKDVQTAFNDKYRPKVKAGQLLSKSRLSNILKSIGLHWLPTAKRHESTA